MDTFTQYDLLICVRQSLYNKHEVDNEYEIPRYWI